MSQNVYYVAYPRSSQAYNDARTPTWLNQIRYYNVCLNFCVPKCLLCCMYQKLSGIQWSQDSNLAEPDKILQRLPKILCRQIFIMLHIPEALRHIMMPGVQPGWNRKIYNICLKFCLKMVTMLHIPKALRDTVKPGLQPGCTRKDIQIRVETQLYLYFWCTV